MECDDFEISRAQIESGNRFDGLLFANNNVLIVFNSTARVIKAISALNGSVIYTLSTGSLKPPCIDQDRLLYYIDEGLQSLRCVHADTGEALWQSNLPREVEYASVEMGGKYVYVYALPTGYAACALYAYDRQGEIKNLEDRTGQYMWRKDGLGGWPAGIIEDTMKGRILFLTTWDIYQFSLSGVEQWSRNVWDRGYMDNESVLPPILGKDRRIWVYCPNSLEWWIIDPETGGGIYKSGTYDSKIYAACAGTDGRLYVATKRDVTCYKDWDEEVWKANFGQYIDDMIMGADDKLYLVQLYSYHSTTGMAIDVNDQKIFTLDPSNGAIINEFEGIGVDRDVLDYIDQEDYESINNSFLAIGDKSRLAFLHRSGLIQVYSPTIEIMYFIPLGN